MKSKNIIAASALLLVLVAAGFLVCNHPIQAQSASDTPEVIKKLNEIAAGQKTIMQELASIKEELYVVKIRVTQNQ